MTDHTEPLRSEQEEPMMNAYGRGFMNGYELACADAVRELMRVNVPAEVRGLVAAMVTRSADRWNVVMGMLNTPPAPHGGGTSQEASGG
jgi:hypothetical protein